MPQTPASSEAHPGIFGRVIDAETHEAVRRAAIKVYTSKEQWDQFTDGEGRFRFPDLAPGDYFLIAHRDGYSDRAYQVERSDFVAQKELSLELHRQGVIAGRVTDGAGQPIQRATIEALRPRNGGGIDVAGGTESNDLGEYRLAGLNPGTYQVRATFREGRNSELDTMPVRLATAWYGGSDKAPGITVKTGGVSTGIDFTLDTVSPATVRGTLRTEAGVLSDPATLWILGQAGEGGNNATGRDGKFEIQDVAPGTYSISAQTLDKTSPLFGIATVSVRGADVDNVEIVLRPVPRVDVEVRMEGNAPVDLSRAAVYFVRTAQVTAWPMEIGLLGEDKKFPVSLIPGDYSISFEQSIVDLGVRSVTLDDEPVTNWRLRMNDSPVTRKMVIVIGSKASK
jgi:hypothetical protein